MKNSLWLTVLAISLVGGALASLVAHPILSPSASNAGEVATPAETEPMADLLARLDALAEKNDSLLEKIELIEHRPQAEQRTPIGDWVTRAEFDALREELLQSVEQQVEQSTPLAMPAAALEENFKQQVAKTLSTIRKEEKVEAVRGYHQKRTARLDADVAKLEDWLELSSYQTDEMRATLTLQYEREDEQRRLWEENEDTEFLGERKRMDGELFRSDLEQFLSAEQLETFWQGVIERRSGK